MSKPKIVVIVDNPQRDLPACVLLSAKLAEFADAYLVSTSQAPAEIFRIAPDLVLLNYLRITNLPLVKKLIRAGIPFSVLDTEGGLFLKLNETGETSFTLTLVKDEAIRNQIAQYFVWGEGLTEDLKSKSIYPADRLLCLGTPRMDFYHPSFKEFFVEGNERRTRPMILVNTSFPGINPRFLTRESEFEMLVKKFNYGRGYLRELFSKLDEVMKGYIELTRQLALKFPEADFLLRPHPFENLAPYKEALKDFKNVTVHCEGTVARWIFESEALIHYECSTALEAAFVGKPVLSLAGFKDVRPNEQVALVTEYVDSTETFQARIGEILAGRYRFPEKVEQNLKEIEREIYFKVDGESHVRIANSVEKWLSENRKARTAMQTARILRFGTYQMARSALKFVVKRGRLVPDGKRFDVRMVQDILNRVQRTKGLKAKVEGLPLSTALKIQDHI